MKTVIAWALIVALCAGVVLGIVHGYEVWRDAKVAEGDKLGAARTQGKWDADVLERDGEKLAAIQAAREEEQHMAAEAAKGERDAREKAERSAAADRAAAGRATAAHGSLRESIEALDRAARDFDLTNAAALPGELVRQRDAAVRARELLRACSARYVGMAADVDDAWRGITLKLDTALGYIHAVKP